MSQPITVECPTCGAPVEWKEANAFRPFCSDRCKLIDLGAWAAEDHKIAGRRSLRMSCIRGIWSPGTDRRTVAAGGLRFVQVKGC